MKFLYYTLIRLAVLLVAFYVCWWLGTGLVLAGVFGILISFAVSYLIFPKLHTAAGQEFARFWQRITGRSKTVEKENASVEDEYVDEQLRREGRDV